ncbi:hypothetical protein [Thermincola ferriacetica]
MVGDNSFSDLVLLVGTNPLPNYVVAKYFLAQNSNLKRIWFFCSEGRQGEPGTDYLADNLEKVLQEEYGKDRILFPKRLVIKDTGDAVDILGRVEEMFKDARRFSDCSEFHLNYTGGTKAMAVHVYRGIEQQVGRMPGQVQCSFSYLDARDHCLKHDGSDVKTGDLRKTITLELQTLLKLHNYRLHVGRKDDRRNKILEFVSDLAGTTDMFRSVICGPDGAEKICTLAETANTVLRPVLCDQEGNFADKFSDYCRALENMHHQDGTAQKAWPGISGTELQELLGSEFMQIIHGLPAKHAMTKDGVLAVPGRDDREEWKKWKKLFKDYFGGKWLEHYVYSVICENINKEGLGTDQPVQVEIGWEFTKNESGGKNKKKPFELDVVVVNGYQVCGISITTDRKQSLCKEKSFEILHRVHQIGGDEAKAIMVTFLDENHKEELEEDIRDHYSALGNRFKLLGINDIKPDKLWAEIREIIWDTN